MLLRDIPTEFSFDITFFPISKDEMPDNGIGRIESKIQRGEYSFFCGQNIFDVKIKEENKINDFNLYVKRGCANLSEILIKNPNGSVLIKTVFFYGGIVNMEQIDIGIDDKTMETIKNYKINEHKLQISVNGENYFIGMFGYASLDDFDKEDGEKISLEKFSIYGQNIKIPVEKKKIKITEKVVIDGGREVDLEKEEEIFFANKIVLGTHRETQRALRLVKANIKFSDWTKGETGKLRDVAAGAIKNLCKDENSYLRKWDEYGNLEGEMLLEKARKIGQINFEKYEKIKDGYRFYVPEDYRDLLNENDQLEIVASKPVYLSNLEMSFKEYSKILERELDTGKRQDMNDDDNDEKSNSGTITKIYETYIELDYEGDIPKNTFLIYSILGDKIQIKRKMEARKNILEGRSANPMLGILIEENGELPLIQRVTKIKPLSSYVKNKIFKHEPTETQKEAIEIALNTPDIALIQGPPGTGKTTVVTAIIERLNEEFNKTQNICGQILVSGFQHDAVENIISRLSVNSLPAVKFGGRKNDEKNNSNTSIDDWCKNIAKKIRKKNPQIKESEEQQRLDELFYAYTITPSIKNAQAILQGIAALPRNIIPQDLAQKAEGILEEIKPELESYDSDLLRLIYGIRTNEDSFADDGRERIEDLLYNEKITQFLKDDDKKYLESISVVDNFEKIRKIRTNLLKRFTPKKVYKRDKKKNSILTICAEANKHLNNAYNCADKKDKILIDFLSELENNPNGILETIKKHSFVFAATTGQSMGKSIFIEKSKLLSDKKKSIKYDTVIIDEAARVSPRDLMIPMSFAEKRIILVGDHRQLPHIVNEDIAKKFENEENPDEAKFIKESCFQYMFARLKKLEEKDNIKRTITLDAQYRMHPLLGNFVSDNFYKIHNIKESFRSPLKEKYFTHNLSGIENKPAVWVDIPSSRGKEERDSSGGRYREAEIKEIVKLLKKWKGSEQSKELSFGVISFYKVQADKISKKLESEDWGNGIKVGTVDSFQGMEFDIVLLSMVRTKGFGFLKSKNRLCVSMSRQKRALIIVGDKDLAVSEQGKKEVLELANFYELATNKGTVL